jgi:Ca2+/H+ antiporter
MKTADQAVLKLSRASTLTLLVIYLLYLLFQLKSHGYLIGSGQHQGIDMRSSIGSLMQRRQDYQQARSSPMSPFSRTIRFVDEDARPPLDSNVKSRNTIELNTVDPREPSESNTETGVLSDTEDLMDDADRPNRGRQSSTGQQNEAPGVNDTTNLPHSRAHSSSTSRQSLRRLSNQDGFPPYRTARQGLMGSTS